MGIVLQSGNLLPTLSVGDNLKVSMLLAGRMDQVWGEVLLKAVGISERVNARPGQLSGGELARAGLAVALAASPRILLADEPTGEVDAVTESFILNFLAEQRQAGLAVLVATHSQALAVRADRIISLQDGRIVDA